MTHAHAYGLLSTLSFNRGDLIILSSQIAWVVYTLQPRPRLPASC